jgi:AAHS family 4-hydroxybenzoate transporter-like MFS transporter
MSVPQTFTQVLNSQPTRPMQWVIVATCMLLLVVDGIDLQLLGIVAPKVMEAFAVDRGTFGIAMGGALVGFGLGSWGGGWLGDRIGRRWTLAIAALVFSLATVGAGSAGGVWEMAAWRVVGGLGFGAAYANALALASEWLPERWRAVSVSTLSVGTPIGGTVVGWIGPDMAAAYGWDGAFVRIGLATLILVVIILAVLRDSPSFLMARGKQAQAQRTARLVGAGDIPLLPETHASDNADGVPAGVFDRANRRLTVGVGLAFAAAALVAYAILSWSTTMLTTKGFSLEVAGNAVAVAGITSMIGSVLVGLAVRQFGSKRVLLVLSAVLLVVLLALAWAVERMAPVPTAADYWLVTALIGAAGGFFSACIAALYVMMALGYPQSCRSTGIGLGIFWSRFGAVTATALGGVLLEIGGTSTIPFFAVLVAASVLIAAAAFVVDRHVPPMVR